MEFYRPQTKLSQGDFHPIVRLAGDREQSAWSQVDRLHSLQKWTTAVVAVLVVFVEEGEVVVVGSRDA